MRLGEAIDGWVLAHHDALSAATRNDINDIGIAAAECGFASLDCTEVGEPQLLEIIDGAVDTSNLNAEAIGQFLGLVVEWATDPLRIADAPEEPGEPDPESDNAHQTNGHASGAEIAGGAAALGAVATGTRVDDGNDEPDEPDSADESDDDDDSNTGADESDDSDSDDKDEPDTEEDDDESDDSDSDEDESDGSDTEEDDDEPEPKPDSESDPDDDPELAGLTDDDIALIEADLEVTNEADFDDDELALIDSDLEAEAEAASDGATDSDGASSFFSRIGESSADLSTLDVPAATPVAAAAPATRGVFSEAAAAGPNEKRIDWITVAYFTLAAICFVAVIYFYVTG